MTNYLIADIGGTNSRLAIYNSSKDKIILKKKFKTNSFDSLTELIIKFLSQVIDKHKILVSKSVIAIAGNTTRKKLRLGNAKIKIDKVEISNKTSIKEILFLNDLEAKAHYFKESYKHKHEKLVIFPGTGLGVSCISYNRKKNSYIVRANEWGHIKFRASNETEKSLKEYIKNNFNIENIEWETLLSGGGLERIYSYLSNSKKVSAKNITKNYNKDRQSKETIKLFLELLRKFSFKLSKDDKCKEIVIGGHILREIIKVLSEKELKIYMKTYEENKINLHISTQKDTTLLGIINYIKYHF